MFGDKRMKRPEIRFLYLALSAALGSLAVACSPKAPTMTLDGTATADLEVEKIFQEACEHFDKGSIGEADEGFARIIREFPNDALTRAAAVYRARIALKLDNPERARALLAPVKGDDDPVAERALLYDGAALALLGRHEEAVAVLEPLVDKLTDPEDIQVLEDTLWNTARKAGDMKRAAASVDRLLTVLENPSDRREVLRAFKRFLVSITEIEKLDQALEPLSETSKAREAVEERKAAVYMEAGQFQKAKEILDALAQNADAEEAPGEPTQPLPETPPEDVDLNAVGLLAPLSGRARLVGDAALKGATLGAEEAGVRLAIRDSKGDPEAATEAVESLVARDRVSAIIGPLNAAAAKAAARKAEELGVPMLAMSVQEDVASVGDFVFREFAANKIEPVALIDICRSRGARRFGILFPESGYGRAMRAMYVSALQNAGLSPAAEASYPQDAVNFKEQAEALSRENLDVLFIAGHSSRIPLIVPALAAAGLTSAPYGREPVESGRRPIQLIVPSVGFSEDLLRRAGRYLDGALFCVFFAPETGHAAQAFASKYHLKFGTRPTVIAAYGRDAVLIAARALKDGSQSRRELRQWLVGRAAAVAPSIGTATPFNGFTPNGAPKAVPYILEVVDGELSILDETRPPSR